MFVMQMIEFFDKAIEGFVMFALNQGEVCTCPSRALYMKIFMINLWNVLLKRTEAIIQGDRYILIQ